MPWQHWTLPPYQSYDPYAGSFGWQGPARVSGPYISAATPTHPTLPGAVVVEEDRSTWVPLVLFGVGLVAGLLLGRGLS